MSKNLQILVPFFSNKKLMSKMWKFNIENEKKNISKINKNK